MRHTFTVSVALGAVLSLAGVGTAGATTPPTTPAAGSTAAAGTAAAVPEGPHFGTMPSPCGPATDQGVPTIAEGQNGGAALKLGVATDKGYAARSLNPDMYDAAVAFAGWCNEQGGIRGLPIEIVDLDGKLFEVPVAIEKACAEAFAMVGGGYVFDDQMFPRFHECKMVNFAGYSVTAAAAMNNAKVEPMPNPLNDKPASWLQWAKKTHPDAITRTAIVYTDFGTTIVQKDMYKAQMAAIGGYTVVDEIPTNPAGEANWAPFAQRMKDKNVGMVTVAGSAATVIGLFKAMREIGFVPELVLLEGSLYTESLVAEGDAQATEGAVARSAFVPFEEPDQPAMKSYLDMMAKYNPTGNKAGLGLQATSAFLLFVVAANDCLDANNNVLERECVLAAGKKITSWTAGGLQAETNPGQNLPPTCGLLMTIKDGKWTRLYPEIGSADDNGSGFHCDGADGSTHIEGNFGDPTPGIDPTRDQ